MNTQLKVKITTQTLRLLRCSLFIITALICNASYALANDTADIWQDVAAGKSIVILRHALAPGTGDPAHFDVNQCDTQRNLSTAGQQQAKRIGNKLKERGLANALVYTSQWCRCVDTANAMSISTPITLPALNSFYGNPEKGPAQIDKLIKWLSEYTADKPLILVTHQVVISALTAVYPASGEAIVFKLHDNNTIDVIHRLKTQ